MLDGDLGEWSSLLPPAGAPGSEALSHAAVAFTGDGLRVAAELHGAARAGLWIGLRFDPLLYPVIGTSPEAAIAALERAGARGKIGLAVIALVGAAHLAASSRLAWRGYVCAVASRQGSTPVWRSQSLAP